VSDIVFRPYREGDETAINDGFNRTFALTRSLEEWHWKFPSEPEGRWIMLALDARGALLAHYGAVASRFSIGGEVVRGGQIVDAYAVPEAQGSRVFTSCYEEFIRRFGNGDDLPLMFGFPGTRHYEMGLKVLKYVPIGPVPFWRRQLDRQRLSFRLGVKVRRGFDRGAVDGLWRRAEHRYACANVRDGAWLVRRLSGRPGASYVHLSAWRLGRLEAWAVTRRFDDRMVWVELLWDGRSRRSLATLASEVLREAGRNGCASVDLWLGGDPLAAEVLAELGWVSLPQPDDLRMVARTFHPRVDLDRMRGELYLTAADSDLV